MAQVLQVSENVGCKPMKAYVTDYYRDRETEKKLAQIELNVL